MSLFLKQNETRSELQTKVAAELQERIKTRGAGNKPQDVGNGILEESQEATGRSLFWVGVVTMSVIALVVFVLFVFNF
jgi:hypothetical protein